jgi:hypothetical protein
MSRYREIRDLVLSPFEIKIVRNDDIFCFPRNLLPTDMNPELREAVCALSDECAEAVEAHPDWDEDCGTAFCLETDSCPQNSARRLLVWWRLKRGVQAVSNIQTFKQWSTHLNQIGCYFFGAVFCRNPL